MIPAMDRQGPDFAAWIALVEAGLRGKRFDDLAWRTDDGFRVPALVRREDVASLPHREAESLLRARHGHAIRDLCTTPDPRLAAARIARALAHGADEVEICLDSLAHDAISPGGSADDGPDADPLATPPPGEGGVAVHTPRDLELLLHGVDLAQTSLAFSAGEGAFAVLVWLLRLARARGVDPGTLRCALDIDPIEQILSRRLRSDDDGNCVSTRTSPDAVFDTAAALIGFVRAHARGIRPLVCDAQSFHLAGASAALEIGLLLAATAESARGLVERGIAFDDLTAAATLRVQVGHEVVTEIAKLRALRLTFAKLARAFGASGEGLVPRILALTSSRYRADLYDHRTNLIRSAIAATAAVIGGCDSLIVMPFDGSDDERARDLALDQQNLLRFEAQLGRVVDPAGGSGAVEATTDGIARAAWQHLQDIEREGGLLAVARSGRLAELLGTSEQQRERSFRSRARGLVGISRYADLELGGAEEQEIDFDALDQLADASLNRFEGFLRKRDEAKMRAHIQAMRRAPTSELMTKAIDAGADHLTLEELVTATWPRTADYVHRYQPFASADGAPFEALRAQIDAMRENREPLPVVALIRLGDSARVVARADFARDLLRGAGIAATEITGRDIDAAREDLVGLAPAAVVLCAEDEAGRDACIALRGALAEGTMLVWAGKPDAALSANIDLAIHLGADVARALQELLTRIDTNFLRREDDL